MLTYLPQQHSGEHDKFIDAQFSRSRTGVKGFASIHLGLVKKYSLRPLYVPLYRLQLDVRHWCYLTRHFEHPFKHLVGAAHHARSACEALGQRWVQGISQCERLFSSG